MNFEYENVSSAAISGMVVSGIIALAVPILLLIVWKKKSHAKISSFFIGCGTFVVFALVIESIFHSIILGHLAPSIMDNFWLYGPYGGFMAGLFEETGRFVSMKFLMKKNLNKENAIMYGIGHGGIEAILLCTVTEISNIATSMAINGGGIDFMLKAVPDEATRQELYQQISQLWTISPDQFFAAGIERMSAITFHIAASYIVYKAVKDKKISKYILAIVLHMGLDSITVFLNSNGVEIWIIEIIVAVYSAAVMLFAIRDYKVRD